MNILPITRETALINLSRNIPYGMSRETRSLYVSDNAVAAWRYCNGPSKQYLKWAPYDVIGPRIMILYIENGPTLFENKWISIFLYEIVSKSKLFKNLPIEILQHILMYCRKK